jgi:hypothetical protein
MNMQHEHIIPAFNLAIDSLERFLKEQGQPQKALWIFREDITWHDGKFFIKLPLPAENQSLVTQLYAYGCSQGLGVLINMLCVVDSQPCCHIWLPKNEREAELALLAGLKFSSPSNPPIAQAIFSSALWRFHVWQGRHSDADKWLDQVPKRSWSSET